ncbi:hypothetical protein N431DRAFT_562537 [Stipitochalara longipes BDJ]|nr:hypothetical protein N431DRAFT_562537 [Stipitochalara longipes BDJ]
MNIPVNSAAMLASLSSTSDEGLRVPTIRTAPTRNPLSCVSCRQRKIRCERVHPCDQCVKSGIDCVFPTRRVRAPKAHKGSAQARDAELLNRIKRLEEMLARKSGLESAITFIGKSRGGENPILLAPVPPTGQLSEVAPAVTLDDHFSAFAKQQASSSRHLDNEFWSSLSNEFDGLRQLIEGDVDDEDEVDESTSQSAEASSSSPSFIFQDSNSLSGLELVPPSPAHTAVLLRSYFANVDPVCKILHRPTATAYFSNIEALVDPLTHQFKFKSFAAVTFAAYFAAVASMSSEDCLAQLGASKDTLVARFRRDVELALVKADFLNSLEIITLQAFTIYIVVQRSLNRSQSTWALIGLAIRIAQGLGLHMDGDGHVLSAFEGEIRRRLWWQILALDLRASEDRGSEPILAENSSNTYMPRNLNDGEFMYNTQHPLDGRTGPTDITLCLLTMDALHTSRKINFASQPAELENSTLIAREVLVREYAHRVESTYLAGYDFSDERTKLLCLTGHYWISKLWLTLYYPLRHRVCVRQPRCGIQGLQKAITFLNVHEMIEQHPASAGFTWLLKTYVPWHALAIVLAELFAQPTGPLADRAWEIIESRFDDWNSRVADAKEAMIWGSIKKLLKRARAARQNSHVSLSTGQALNTANPDPTFEDFNAFGTSNVGFESNSSDIQPFDNFGFLGQTPNEQLDFLNFAPMNTFPTNVELSAVPNELDNWNDFMFDMNALGGEILPDIYSI